MRFLRTLTLTVFALFALGAAPLEAAAVRSAPKTIEAFTGVLADTAGSASIPVTLHVDAFTSARRVALLSRAIGDKGQAAAISALEHMKPRGWIRVGKELGYEVPIIRSFTTAKGQRIVAVLDRPIEIWDELRRTRSLDYPFGLMELNLDTNGNGNGRLIAATRALFTNDGKIEMENYGTKPFRIIGVTEQVRSE